MSMELHQRRMCKCTAHTGQEQWHGTQSGYQYHKCPCERCTTFYLVKPVEKVCLRDGCKNTFAASGNAKYCSSDCRRIALKIRRNAWYAERAAVLGPSWHHKSTARKRVLWEKQNGLCALCNQPVDLDKAYLDHDHNHCPAKVALACGNCDRGVLHPQCNSLLGMANDDVDRLRQAIKYLGG